MDRSKLLHTLGSAAVAGVALLVTAANALADCVDRTEMEKQLVAEAAISDQRFALVVPGALRSFDLATLSLSTADLIDPRTQRLRNDGFHLVNPDTGGTLEISEANRAFFTDPSNSDTLIVPTNPTHVGFADKPRLLAPAAPLGRSFPWGGAGLLIRPNGDLSTNLPSKVNGEDDLKPTKPWLPELPHAPGPKPPQLNSPPLTDSVVAVLNVKINGDVERCNGLQVLPGRVATALHCTDSALRIYVYFGELRPVAVDGKKIRSAIDFSGAYRCAASREFPAETDAQLAKGALDIAILRVPTAERLPGFKDAYTPFGSPSAFDGPINTELSLAWISPVKNSRCPYLGKCSDTSVKCRIESFLRTPPAINVDGCGRGEPYGKKHREDKIYTVDGLTHSCDTHESNSGAALLSRDRSRVLAIHMRGAGNDGTDDARNCAVPAEWIRTKLGGEFAARWKSD